LASSTIAPIRREYSGNLSFLRGYSTM
jgi:hypothetical protein